ncbi:MAG: SRPBCC domain-containing protein [Verrucomicrobia subdivision 3 bacterium]|nr:SRPBCC domain-containing protein [Limisphaerales bacterium]
MNDTPFTKNKTFATPRAEVWEAITDPAQMRQWYFEQMPNFKPEVGFEIEFNVRCEDRDFLHCWKVTEVITEKKIAYRWRYGGYAGDSLVTWELSDAGENTRLTFTHAILAPFPPDDPIFAREGYEAGWNYFLNDRLPPFLETD